MATRRTFLLASTLVGAGAYTYQRGLRFPRLGFEHRALHTSAKTETATFNFSQAILRKPSVSETLDETAEVRFRAIAPEPSIDIQTRKAASFTIRISNVAANTKLEAVSGAGTSIDEQIEGTTRKLNISFAGPQNMELNWVLAEQNTAKFAVIGDTGAGLELEWVLQRAHQLGADFLLHLGDFNYSAGEYDRAVQLFDSAALPCYVSIGNHDYNESGLIYQQFLDEIGPMNHSFNVAGTRFVNIDTAANFLPASGGQRGDLFRRLQDDPTNFHDQVFFTHRPFVDIRPGQDHNISGIGEMDWLAAQIKNSGGNTLLCGHVHRSGEADYQGINQWTAGEGLGFEDIVHQKPVAKILIGEIEEDKQVRYQWLPLDMPWAAHRSPAHKTKLIKEHSVDALQWYQRMLETNPVS